MIERLKKYNQWLIIAGFRKVKIGDTARFFTNLREKTSNACVQFFDASLIAGREHLRFAALNALNAFNGKVNISNSLAVETLLYASARRQINEAVRLLGVKPESCRIAILILAKSRDQASSILEVVSNLLSGERDDSVIELTDDKVEDLRKFFRISNLELAAVVRHYGVEKKALLDLVIEHMALLITRR